MEQPRILGPGFTDWAHPEGIPALEECQEPSDTAFNRLVEDYVGALKAGLGRCRKGTVHLHRQDGALRGAAGWGGAIRQGAPASAWGARRCVNPLLWGSAGAAGWLAARTGSREQRQGNQKRHQMAPGYPAERCRCPKGQRFHLLSREPAGRT